MYRPNKVTNWILKSMQPTGWINFNLISQSQSVPSSGISLTTFDVHSSVKHYVSYPF